MAEAEHHHAPGEPPEIRDEAADTPMWVPAFGLALLLLGAVFLVWQSNAAPQEDEAAEAEAAEGDEAEAPDDEAAEGDGAEAAPTPAPAE